MAEPAITVSKLSKTFEVPLGTFLRRKYRHVTALKNISLKINRGEFVGIIGPNGAGKSTLIKALTGILTPSSGEARILGYVPYKERQKYTRHIGVVFGQRTQLWWDLPVRESYALFREIYGIPDSVYRRNMQKFNKILGINRYAEQPVRKLSLGERMRCDLAAALLHDPEIIFLDEPTIGLDVEAKWRMRQFLKETNAAGRTIILTTHDMGDVEELCERLIIIDRGRIIYDGPTAKVRERAARQRAIMADFGGPPPRRIVLPAGAAVASREGDKIVVNVNIARCSVSKAVKWLLTRYKIEDMATQEPSIEEIIRKIYRREK